MFILFHVKYFFRVNLEERIFHNENNSAIAYGTSTLLDNSTLTNTNSSISTESKMSDTILGWTISRQTCIIVFAVLTFSMILATLIRSATFVTVCMRASMNLHNKMFNAITRATMYFFNTNSSGKIVLK